MDYLNRLVTRRQFVTGASKTLAIAAATTCLPLRPLLAENNTTQPNILTGKVFDLTISEKVVNFTGQNAIATVVNQQLPGPTLRFKQGDTVTIRVSNKLKVPTSIHWHGIILPTEMDGVPSLSFQGIMPGETFTYQFTLNQSGTYWYHSHSGFQEQTGLYGAIVVEKPEPERYQSDHVIQLSDWSDEHPETIYANLKKLGHYYNRNERTVADTWHDIKTLGLKKTFEKRSMWESMRMSSRDLADVTGETYTYLINGNNPDDNFTALFKAGGKVRLRFINSAAMTLFDVRIPGLKMRVIACDGQDVEPVTVDEFRMGTAETVDVEVEPNQGSAYCIFAQASDRSGYARATLSAHTSLKAEVPAMDFKPELTMEDMGMAMMHHGSGHGEHHMHHGMQATEVKTNGKAGFGSNTKITHAKSEQGPQVDMLSEMPASGLDDPGVGLREHQKRYQRKVLSYGDIKNRYRTEDTRQPSREIMLHLTGNMSRYMWSINGIKYQDADPIVLQYGERVRFTLVNDTMMAHPVHLHGLWSELETNEPDYIPKKHTVIVQPGKKISYLVTANARGRWAYHCHLLYHMPGMFREVRVV